MTTTSSDQAADSRQARILGEREETGMWEIELSADGPLGSLPLTSEMLIEEPSGNIFGMTQNAGMGWNPDELLRTQFMILSTMGGMRGPDGKPLALGIHTGHFELGLLIAEAADELRQLGALPYAAYCSDPCDGRTQGTTGMLDSLPYRNDAATIFRRLARSVPTAKGVLGIATCDKGLPAMMMAMAGLPDRPSVLVPGGVTLPPTVGENAAEIQSIGARHAQGELSLVDAASLGCHACGTPGGGCQFLGTAGTSQVIAEALGLSVTHSALAPSGQDIWLDNARRSAAALVELEKRGVTSADILTDDAFENAMVVHAACGGSTNLILHLPAIAHAAGRKMMTVDDWHRLNLQVPRLVDVLPNGPVMHPTVQFFAAGGVPELMLHLRRMGLLKTDVMTVTGQTLGETLDWWEDSERRTALRKRLADRDGVDPDDVIMDPDRARSRGLTSTVTFPTGNIAPEGSVIKSTAIDRSVVDDDGVYRNTGPARVFRSEIDTIRAVKSRGDDRVKPGEIIVMTCGGPLGTGMEEVFQVTVALKYLSYGKEIALLTDARFSGVSTGACIGHIGPEALAGGPIGRIRDGDLIRIEVDQNRLEGTIDLVGHGDEEHGAEWGTEELARRGDPGDLAPHPRMPDDSRLWAALQHASGGTWNGCVYDVDRIVETLDAGMKALGRG
ncbi:MAG: YjhG/YagF family D-xylonate dehydratase [Chloroflexi bacterium]|nr:YjhG/YagF family D-xylonate dehydratase [Chloroflexota bacterium]